MSSPLDGLQQESVSGELTVESLAFSYPRSPDPALDGVSLTVPGGEVLSLLGKSGSGKSTLLRLVAGLERPGRGTISIDGIEIASAHTFTRPERRNIGLVPQGCDLFPHLTVARNIAYGLRKWTRVQKRDRVTELLGQIDLPDYARRLPAELSGGETQRIALARALAPKPQLLLLDEPFSNLDVELRETLRTLTADLLRSQGTTAIFVTHHSDDAFSISDRVAVMAGGRILQIASPREICKNPASSEIAALFGNINVLPENKDDPDAAPFARPDQLVLDSDTKGCLATGTGERIEFLGSFQRVTVKLESTQDNLRVDTAPETALDHGETVGVRWKGTPGSRIVP